MYISGINGYLSKFEGVEVDAAVERVQNIDAELALKVDKTTTINGISLRSDIVLTPEDIGSIPAGEGYGKSILWADSILHLKDQNGRTLSSQYIEVDLGKWGRIYGTLADQTDLKDALDSKQPMITSEAMLSSDLVDDTNHVHKFATADQLQQIATNTSNIATNTADIATNAGNIATNTADIATNAGNIATNTSNIATNTADIATINGKIPTQASTSNQLADKAFVNSSIATSTATFRGTFNSLADLEAYSGPKDDNDYAFVVTVDAAGNTLYNRYKYDGTQWLFEYALNNSSFTAAQWASIQSGITSADVTQITTNKNDISTINGTLSGFGNIVTHNVDEFATAAQGAKADTALQNITGTMVTDALGYTPYNATNPAGYISGITSSDVTTALGYTPYNATNPAGYISGITSSDVTTALGYTPYNSTNPDGFISGITSSDVTTALGFTPYDSTNPAGYISGINSTDVVNALGYTPYNSTNPDGFISSAALNTLTDTDITNVTNGQHLVYDSTSQKWKNSSVTSLAWGNITGTLADQTDLQTALNGKQPTITGAATTITSSDLTVGRVLVSNDSGKVGVSGITTAKLGYLSDVTSNIQVQLNNKYDASNPAGYISGITSSDVTTALGFTPYNATNPNGYISGITSSDVTTALGFTPYNSTNPNGYISGITSSDVTTALGYTPYNSTNPSGYISSAAVSTLTDVNLSNLANGEFLKYNSTSGKWENSTVVLTTTLDGLTDVTITNPTQGQNLTYDAANNKWINTSTSATMAWGGLTGDIDDQTDLKNALAAKQDTITGAATTITSNDLTASRVLVSDSSGKVAAGTITTTKLGYLTDVTSNIQAQLNNKISSAAVSTLTDVDLSSLSNGQILAYDSASQKWKNTSSSPGGATSLDGLTDVDITSPSQGQNLTYDAINNKWINTTTTATVGWGGITGNINDQTDLKNALDSKASVTIRDWSVS